MISISTCLVTMATQLSWQPELNLATSNTLDYCLLEGAVYQIQHQMSFRRASNGKVTSIDLFYHGHNISILTSKPFNEIA